MTLQAIGFGTPGHLYSPVRRMCSHPGGGKAVGYPDACSPALPDCTAGLVGVPVDDGRRQQVRPCVPEVPGSGRPVPDLSLASSPQGALQGMVRLAPVQAGTGAGGGHRRRRHREPGPDGGAHGGDGRFPGHPRFGGRVLGTGLSQCSNLRQGRVWRPRPRGRRGGLRNVRHDGRDHRAAAVAAGFSCPRGRGRGRAGQLRGGG